jgi:hypothetical protein
MAEIEMRLIGFDKLERKLGGLPDKVRGQAVAKGLRAAATVGRKVIRSATPVGPTGNLRRSTIFRIRRYARVSVAVIGHRWGPGSHAHLIEEGTDERVRDKIGGTFATPESGQDSRSKSTGRVQPTHFMRRAFRAIEGRLAEVYGRTVLNEIETLMRRP